jgi:hypothetical protein
MQLTKKIEFGIINTQIYYTIETIIKSHNDLVDAINAIRYKYEQEKFESSSQDYDDFLIILNTDEEYKMLTNIVDFIKDFKVPNMVLDKNLVNQQCNPFPNSNYYFRIL